MQEEGLKGIYRGYWATVSHFGPWSAFYFLFYEKYKKMYSEMTTKKPEFFSIFVMAALAGVTSSSLVNWIDVVKVRL